MTTNQDIQAASLGAFVDRCIANAEQWEAVTTTAKLYAVIDHMEGEAIQVTGGALEPVEITTALDAFAHLSRRDAYLMCKKLNQQEGNDGGEPAYKVVAVADIPSMMAGNCRNAAEATRQIAKRNLGIVIP